MEIEEEISLSEIEEEYDEEEYDEKELDEDVPHPTSYPLEDNWIIWHHYGRSKDWSVESYNKVGSFDNVGDFWRYINNMEDCITSGDMIIFMKEGINPVWEDPENKDGGTIRLLTERKEAYSNFIELAMGVMGRNIFASQKDVDVINGFSVSTKHRTTVFKLWTSKVIDVSDFEWNPELKIDTDKMEFKQHFVAKPVRSPRRRRKYD